MSSLLHRHRPRFRCPAAPQNTAYLIGVDIHLPVHLLSSGFKVDGIEADTFDPTNPWAFVASLAVDPDQGNVHGGSYGVQTPVMDHLMFSAMR
jgi:hypothetical protein